MKPVAPVRAITCLVALAMVSLALRVAKTLGRTGAAWEGPAPGLPRACRSAIVLRNGDQQEPPARSLECSKTAMNATATHNWRTYISVK